MTGQDTGGRHRARLDWHGKLAGVLLGFVAGGMTVNQLTDDFGYRGIMIAAMLGAIMFTASWFRRLPPRSTLSRYRTRLLLLAALAAAVGSVAVPTAWQTWTVVAAAALTATAALVPTDLGAAASLLGGAGLIGTGLGGIGFGIALLIGGHIPIRVAVARSSASGWGSSASASPC